MPGTFGESFWSSARRTPVLYPDAVTLAPEASSEEILAAIDHDSAEASVKDSFADLDLRGAGFRVLFDAQWIMRPPGPATSADRLRAVTGDPISWAVITTEIKLQDWESNHFSGLDESLFPAALLTEPGVALLAGRIEGDIVCGAVLNDSGQAVGVSNVFASGCDLPAAWEGAVTMATALFPAHPLVAYDRPDDLDSPLSQNFTPIGPLRIWTT
ncbi:hypothetical protein [Sphaerisporangium corydalis]|uniref:GNAT family N-acetyltransferase n=1 Tax=Sphaerisporangium corydalis TaxID=1441875 RepID=A0ABV9EBB3_9ACTN|nr:hypothetical protein [Sphaerisporangium corydalis]